MNPYAVVVDAYSSGNQVAPALAARGLEAVHVRSMEDPSAALLATYFPGHFAEERVGVGEVGELAAGLLADRGRPEAVILGTETGAALCDALARELGLPGNDPATSSLRRDKFEMIEALHAAGLRAAAQARAGDAEELVAWRRDQGLKDAIVKPARSAGADDVRRCGSDEEIRAAAAAILGAKNQMGGRNDAAVIQEVLEGTEYVVNAVSREGTHDVCEIWRYTKARLHGRDFVYDHSDLVVDGAGEPAATLGAYLAEVLDALGFRHGPSHAEVMLGPAGPALVEIGPRLQGMASFGVNARGIGYSPLDLTVASYLDPSAFAARTREPYRSSLHARRVFLRCFEGGVLAGYRHEDALRALPSLDFLRWIRSPGDRLVPTVDYFSIPGILVLVHEDPAVIEADFQTVRALEREGLYELG